MEQKYHQIPDCFRFLQELGVMTEQDLVGTEDGFFAVRKSLSDLLKERGIREFPGSGGRRLQCCKYFDDWFLYAVPGAEGPVCSLFKMREQEYDLEEGEAADRDTPGVTVSFIAFRTAILERCLREGSDEWAAQLSGEINRVVAQSGQRHHRDLKAYFLRIEAQAPYLIAELYVRQMLSFARKGYLLVPAHYEAVHQKALSPGANAKETRLPDFIDRNNRDAGRVVCDHDRIYIEDSANPTRWEKLAILATHTANTSFHSFAAEVRFHAQFLHPLARLRVPFLGRSLYDSAIRADLSIDDSEFGGMAPYHDPNSSCVRVQARIHTAY